MKKGLAFLVGMVGCGMAFAQPPVAMQTYTSSAEIRAMIDKAAIEKAPKAFESTAGSMNCAHKSF